MDPRVIDGRAVGMEWPGERFEVDAEAIARYSRTVGFEHPAHFDATAAIGAGFRGIAAPPTFCVVYCRPAISRAVRDPAVEMDVASMVHGAQEFHWEEPVCAGDTITTVARCEAIYEEGRRGFYVFESTSTNQDGRPTVRGVWTSIVRMAR
jgi:acyl dehydratase